MGTEEDRAWQALTTLLQDRIDHALNGAVSELSFQEIVDEEMGREAEA